MLPPFGSVAFSCVSSHLLSTNMMRSSVGICSSVKPTLRASDHHIGHRASGGTGTVLVVVVLGRVLLDVTVLPVVGGMSAIW